MYSRNPFSLFTFSVSRIPFREDPPPDIIPPPWADRSVVHKSYWAAKACKQYLNHHKYSFSRRLASVRKSFSQSWHNRLASGTRWTLVLWTWTFGCMCSPDRFYEWSLCSKEIFLYISKVGTDQFFCARFFLIMILHLLLHRPLVGTGSYTHLALWDPASSFLNCIIICRLFEESLDWYQNGFWWVVRTIQNHVHLCDLLCSSQPFPWLHMDQWQQLQQLQ